MIVVDVDPLRASPAALCDARVALTMATVAALTTPAWTAKARPVAKVAADGASLLVVRIPLATADNGSVQVSVVSVQPAHPA